MIDPGELKEKILIQKRYEVTDDLTGMPVFTYQDLFLLRAKKKTVTTKEFISSQKETTSLILKFIVRKQDITSQNFVLYKNDRFNIKHVHEFDNTFIELTCEKVV